MLFTSTETVWTIRDGEPRMSNSFRQLLSSEREIETDRQTEMERDRDRQTDRQTNRDRERKRERERQGHTQRQRDLVLFLSHAKRKYY